MREVEHQRMSCHHKLENKAGWNLLGFFCLSFLDTKRIFWEAQQLLQHRQDFTYKHEIPTQRKPQLHTVFCKISLPAAGRLLVFTPPPLTHIRWTVAVQQPVCVNYNNIMYGKSPQSPATTAWWKNSVRARPASEISKYPVTSESRNILTSLCTSTRMFVCVRETRSTVWVLVCVSVCERFVGWAGFKSITQAAHILLQLKLWQFCATLWNSG